MKIRTKILLNIFLSILITGIIVILISRIVSKNIVEKQIENNLKNTVLSNTYYIESIISKYKQITELLAVGNSVINFFNPDLNQETTQEQAYKRINSTITKSKTISRIRILNKDGIVVLSSHEDVGNDNSNKNIFIKAKQGTYFGDVHISQFTGNLVISVATPVFVNEEFLGVLIVNFDAKEELFKITTNRVGLGETGEIYLLNREGYMITPSRFVDDVVLKQKVDIDHTKSRVYVSPDLLLEKIQVNVGEYKNYIGAGVYRIHTYIFCVDWVLVVDINKEEIFAPVLKLTNSLLLILLILLLSGVIVAFIISRTITKPLLKLHHGAQEIEKGNLDYKVWTKTKDEIGQLSQAFDKMTGELKMSRERMENYSHELKRKVKDRTIN